VQGAPSRSGIVPKGEKSSRSGTTNSQGTVVAKEEWGTPNFYLIRADGWKTLRLQGFAGRAISEEAGEGGE